MKNNLVRVTSRQVPMSNSKYIFNMLKKIKYTVSELKMSLGEDVRDLIIKSGVESVEGAAYISGNNTERVLDIAETIKAGVETAGGAVGGVESSGALGKIAYKTTRDIARGDTVCTGLCVVSGACETVALCCSTVKIIPCRGRIYIGAKILSRGCMTFRNACAGEGC